MELKEFVTTAIVEVTKGVEDAIAALNGVDCWINPPVGSSGNFIEKDKKWGNRAVQEIEMNVSITADSESGVKGKITVVSGLLNIGGKGDSREGSRTINSLRFKVPISFPVHRADLVSQ